MGEGGTTGTETPESNRDGREARRASETRRQGGGERTERGGARGGRRTPASLLRPPGRRARPAIRAGGRQVVRGRQWRGGVRNLGLNLALPLEGAGPPVHLDAKERRNEYAARAVIGPPRPPPPPPHYNFPNRILQSGPYSLAHKQFCFSALEPVNQAEREHLGRRRRPPRALPRAPPRAPPSGFVPRGSWMLGVEGYGSTPRGPQPVEWDWAVWGLAPGFESCLWQLPVVSLRHPLGSSSASEMR